MLGFSYSLGWPVIVNVAFEKKVDVTCTDKSPQYALNRGLSWGNPWVMERYQRFVASFVDIFETGRSIGEFNPTLPLDVMARFTISALDGIHMGVMAAGPDAVRASEQTRVLRTFLRDNLLPSSI